MGSKMKALLVAIALGLASPAIAADMPVKASVYTPPVAVQSWTGFYLSLEGGWNLGKFSPFCGATCGPEGTTVNLDDNSAFVGGSMRYLIQPGNGILVFGPEAGVQWWGFKSQAELVPAGVETPAVLLQQKIDWVAYLGARVGLSPFERTLIYVNGGAAWAHTKGALINLAAIDTSFSQGLMGWYIGGGLEFKITDTIVIGGEFRHYDFGTVQSANPALSLALGGLSDKLTTNQAMGRVSFKLN